MFGSACQGDTVQATHCPIDQQLVAVLNREMQQQM